MKKKYLSSIKKYGNANKDGFYYEDITNVKRKEKDLQIRKWRAIKYEMRQSYNSA